MLWTEKYAPKNFDEFVGNLKAKKEVMEWTVQWRQGNPQKCLLVVGPPGTGKTTFAHIIASEFSDFVELNASDKRSYDIIMSTVGEAAASRSLFDDGLKLIVLDEVDGLHGTDDRGGIRAINNIIKEGNHPIIMTANDPYSKRIAGFKRKCRVINLRRVHTNSIVAFLKKICAKEEINFEEHVIRALAKRSNGDLRSAITDLEVMAKGGKVITAEDLEITSVKDGESNLFDSVRTVLKSKNHRRIKDSMRLNVDPPFILETIAENIPREYEEAHEIERAFDMISLADIYFGRAFSTRTYTYWKYSFDFMGLGVAFAKDETYKKFARYGGSTVYTKLSKSRAKRDLRDKVAEKIGDKLHVSKKVAISQFPYFEMMFQDDEMAYEMAKYFRLDEHEVKLFRKRKIKVKKPSQSNSKNIKTEKDKKAGKSTKKLKKSVKTNKTKNPENENLDNSSVNPKSKSKKAEKIEKQTSLFNF